ncbi:MAG: O-antigen ligase family protein [Verrucomicrobiales bacterium]
MYSLFLGLLLIGLSLGCVFATGVKMVFQWPAFFILGIAGVVSLFTLRERPRVRPGDWCLLSAALFAGYVSIRAVTSPVGYLARQDLVLVVACFLVYASTALHFHRAIYREAIFWVLAGIGVLNLGVGAVHLGDPAFSLLPGYFRTYGEGRIGGLFNNPNHLGSLLGFLFFVTLGQAIFGRWGASLKLVLAFLAAMMAVGLVLTVSRGALLGFAGGALVFSSISLYLTWHFHREIFVRLATALGALAALCLGVLLSLNMTFLTDRMLSSGFLTDAPRLLYWKAALDQFASSPIIGTGSRTYEYLCRFYRPEGLMTAPGELEFAHSEYLQLLADYGAVGMVLFLLAVVLHSGNGLAKLRWYAGHRHRLRGERSGTHLALLTGCLAGLAGLLTHAVVEFQFHIPAVALPAAIGFGVLANPGFCRRRDQPAPMSPVGFVVAGSLVTIGGALVFFGFNYGRSECYLEKGRGFVDIKVSFDNVALYQRAGELDPTNPQIFRASGSAWVDRIRSGMPAPVMSSFLRKAVDDYLGAYELYPYDVYNLVDLGHCYDGLGMTDKAEEKYLEALEWAPLYLIARLGWAKHLHRMGRFEEAAEAYKASYRGHALAKFGENSLVIKALEERLARDRRATEAEALVPLE